MNIIKISLIFLTLLLPIALLSAEDATQESADKPEISPEQVTVESHVGSVLESKLGGNYLYLKLDVKGQEIWLATNPSYPGGKVSEGDKIQYFGGVEMTSFKSKSLDQTFDKILFITKISKLNAKSLTDFEQVPADDYHSKYVKKEQEEQKVKKITLPVKGEIEMTENGNTIEEIFSAIDRLTDKEVIFRAKAMKVSKNILKKNWITLQDGTGIAPDNKLVATSKESVNAGDILTVKGILKTNIDLGSGYKYKVIIEDAQFTK